MLEDRASHRGNLGSAMIAGKYRASINAIMLPILLTVVAVRNVAGEPLLHEMRETGSIIGKLAVEIIDCVA